MLGVLAPCESRQWRQTSDALSLNGVPLTSRSLILMQIGAAWELIQSGFVLFDPGAGTAVDPQHSPRPFVWPDESSGGECVPLLE